MYLRRSPKSQTVYKSFCVEPLHKLERQTERERDRQTERVEPLHALKREWNRSTDRRERERESAHTCTDSPSWRVLGAVYAFLALWKQKHRPHDSPFWLPRLVFPPFLTFPHSPASPLCPVKPRPPSRGFTTIFYNDILHSHTNRLNWLD